MDTNSHTEKDAMGYHKEVLENPDYLLIRFHGVRNRQNASQMMEDIVLAVTTSKHRNVLLDFRSQDTKTTVVDDYEHAGYLASRLTCRVHRMASLFNEGAFDSSLFFETVCVNRGLALRHFLDETEAIEWLAEAFGQQAKSCLPKDSTAEPLERPLGLAAGWQRKIHERWPSELPARSTSV